jgi:ADP-ribosyl-[dinitrogen reductase] hydrolase
MIKDRCYGCFYGSIIGDALGGPVEFRRRGSFPEVIDMNLFNFNLGLEPGGWTDDTSMMLCLSKSLIENDGQINNNDVLLKYCDWFRKGYMSSKEYCVDIGKQTGRSLIDFEQHGTLVSKHSNDQYAGNGSIMRLTPVPIMFHKKSCNECMNACELSSETTHSSVICKDACKMLGCILYSLINGAKRENIISLFPIYFKKEDIHPELHSIYDGEYLSKYEYQIKSSGYAVHTLEAALFCFMKTHDFKSCLLMAVNLGDDSDTVGCVTGQIAGAFYGITNIYSVVPSWINKLANKHDIDDICKDLYTCSTHLNP